MAQRSDWLPYTRTSQLTMCRTWLSVFAEDTTDSSGQTVTKRVAWGIPDANFNDLNTRFTRAETALTKAQEAETRTPVTTAACKTAFDALVAGMRNVKKRWLLIGALTPADLKSLELQEPDTTPTRSGTPTAQVTIETFLVGRHQLGFPAFTKNIKKSSANFLWRSQSPI